ncbi:MAG: GGDEF domain-containing protein [Arcobacteraceae bacterium]|nr:GGDEF domain-containing protein [Arcobacteraceae bacterium]
MKIKLGLVPSFLIISLFSIIVFTILSNIVISNQKYIIEISNKTKDETFSQIGSQIRLIVNMNRLKTSGEIIATSSNHQERIKAKITAQVLSLDSIFYDNAHLIKLDIKDLWESIANIYNLRANADSIKLQAYNELTMLIQSNPKILQNINKMKSHNNPNTKLLYDHVQLILNKLIYITSEKSSSFHLYSGNSLIEHIKLLTTYKETNLYNKEFEIFLNKLIHISELVCDSYLLNEKAKDIWKDKSVHIDTIQQTFSTVTLQTTHQGVQEIINIAQSAQTSKDTTLIVSITIGFLLILLALLLYIFIFRPLIRTTKSLHLAEIGKKINPKKELLTEIDAIGQAANILGTTVNDLKEQKLELKLANEKLEELSITDQLTGIANRRRFFDRANLELSNIKRYKHNSCILMLDIDFFKKINDTYGHGIGDDALKGFVKEIAIILRDNDTFARLGGEEFSILLPNTNTETALLVADRIKQAIYNMETLTPQGILRFTVSIGISLLKDDDTSVEVALARADEALYEAKKSGRNQIGINI